MPSGNKNTLSTEFTIVSNVQQLGALLKSGRLQMDKSQNHVATHMGTQQPSIPRFEKGVNMEWDSIKKFTDACDLDIQMRLVPRHLGNKTDLSFKFATVSTIEQLGNLLKNGREQMDKSQNHVATHMGTQQPSIPRFEKGVNMEWDSIKKFTDACDLDIQMRLVPRHLGNNEASPL